MAHNRITAWSSCVRARSVPTSVLALWLIGCGGASQPDPHTADDARRTRRSSSDSGDKPYSELKLNPGAEVIALSCEGGFEDCNALDDDCNGIIDDECGYEGGSVQVTVGWNSGADIDLYVTDPSGSTLYYNEQHRRSKIGGHLDHDARGDCRKEQRNSRIENAYWPGRARTGAYRVELHYFSPCAKGSTTEATVSLAVDSELVGSYRYKLEPEQRIEALSFVKR